VPALSALVDRLRQTDSASHASHAGHASHASHPADHPPTKPS
jgi:hypothetical protein